ncbi:hypothetical protein O9K51_06793 [Purpureocillium lavendulum]|uniref:Uncharacterized protein n=1 Tax=Purpureocillium lavendulum TaxID=1247861 RepID=A0AB34FSC3_9HYPO|nr:hypothetical protein O9K51_06793 [Purpureocillium lavendulum]
MFRTFDNMFAAKMAIFNGIMVLVAMLAVGVVGAANAPYSNGQATETAAPQELGSITSAGSLVYSLNMCTIVHSTNCQVSMSTGGAAPEAKSSAAAPAPGSGSSGAQGAYPTGGDTAKAAPTVITTTNAGGSAVVVTQTPGAESSALAGSRTRSDSDASESGPESTGAQATQSSPGSASGTPSGSGVATPTGGANNAVSVVKSVAFGAAAMAMAFLV